MCKLQIENVEGPCVGRRGLEEQLLERISARSGSCCDRPREERRQAHAVPSIFARPYDQFAVRETSGMSRKTRRHFRFEI